VPAQKNTLFPGSIPRERRRRFWIHSSCAFPLKESDEENPRWIRLNCLNIGVGVAKNIRFSFSPLNMERWLSYLKIEFPEKDYDWGYSNGGTTTFSNLDKNGNILVYKLNGAEYGVSKNNVGKFLFFLPEADVSYDLTIPMGYLDVIREIYINEKTGNINIDPIIINIEYDDVQGRHYEQELCMNINNLILSLESDGFGYATYTISMQ
jgi:hypothetical protein